MVVCAICPAWREPRSRYWRHHEDGEAIGPHSCDNEVSPQMSYSLATLWHERQRFLPGVLAVAFSALLIALQCGLLLGLFSITSIPIDHTQADIWVGHPKVPSVDLGRPIPEAWMSYLAMPEVERFEPYM